MNKYEKVRSFYISKLWPINWVTNAVGKWITEEEFQEITGLKYE